MPKSATLRRLAEDTPWLQKRLTVLESWLDVQKIEPYLAVVMAEYHRRESQAGREPGPKAPAILPSMDDLASMYEDPELLAVMKSQADGPWEVYAAQARGTTMARHAGQALADLEHEALSSNPALSATEAFVGTDQDQNNDYRFDVAISCAGADRDFVQRVAQILQRSKLRVYYDDNESNHVNMVGRDLDKEIERIYEREAKHCVAFLSAAYAAGEWTRAELRAMMRRAAADEFYLKPIRLDDTTFPEIPKGLVYFDARKGRPLSDATLLSELLLDALRKPRVNAGAEAILGLTEADDAIQQIREFFDTIAPSQIRWRKDAAMAINASVQYSIIGPVREDWLIFLGPPEPSVTKLNLGEVSDVAILPQHLRIKATVREMIKMMKGNFDARQALIHGTVDLSGDLPVLRKMGDFFQSDGRPKAEDAAAPAGQPPTG